MSSLTASHPFGVEAPESVPAVFWRTILHCGVLAGTGLSIMLWGVREPAVAMGTLLVLSVAISFGVQRVHPRWTILRCMLLAGRIGCSVAASAAVVELAGVAGAVLVAMCVVVTPSVRSSARDLGRWLRHARRSATTRH